MKRYILAEGDARRRQHQEENIEPGSAQPEVQALIPDAMACHAPGRQVERRTQRSEATLKKRPVHADENCPPSNRNAARETSFAEYRMQNQGVSGLLQ